MPFKKGQVANPLGGGTMRKRRSDVFSKLVEPHERALMKKMITLALEGDKDMLKYVLDRIIPAKRTEDIDGKTTEMNQAFFQINTIINEHEKEF